jgi:SAM-dependent methyltransferase
MLSKSDCSTGSFRRFGMDWVEPFYTRQAELLNLFSGGPTEDDRLRVSAIEKMAGSGKKAILELGAGSGKSAAATAELMHNVVAVELTAAGATHARKLAQEIQAGSLSIIQGDFYEVDIPGHFDVVCYWDGFGVGTDADQRRLLQRISGWLAPGGCALIDIYPPWFWAHAAGREVRFGKTIRRYEFDAVGCRLVDHWWSSNNPTWTVAQSLRCYSPADLQLLLEGTGLVLDSIEENGATLDFEADKYYRPVSLDKAWTYLVKLIPA